VVGVRVALPLGCGGQQGHAAALRLQQLRQMVNMLLDIVVEPEEDAYTYGLLRQGGTPPD
jgi:hypothetical protein